MSELQELIKSVSQLANAVNVMSRALVRISDVAGNLSDEQLTTRTGPNDAVGRGLMVVEARSIALEAIAKARGEA